MKIEAASSGPVNAVFSSLQKIQLVIIFGFFLLVGTNSGGFGVILPNFSATYGLNKSDTGGIFVAITAGYLIAALAGSWLTERFGLRNFLTGGLVLFAAGSLGMWVLPPLALALFARLVLGLAGAALETGGNFYVAFLPRNTAILNYLHAFFGVGALIGPLVATWVLENQWGWNNLFLIWLGATLVLGIGFRLAFGRMPISSMSSAKPEDEPTRAIEKPMVAALKHRSIWLATIFLLVYVGVETTVGSWSFTYLSEGQHFSTALAGWLVSLYWLGLTVGRFALGWLVEWAATTGHNRLVILGCVVVSMIGAGLVWLASAQPIIAGIGLFIIGFSYGPLYPTILAILSRLVDPALIASAMSLIIGLSILGVAIFPWLAGILFDGWGLAILFPYILAVSVVMIVLGAVLLSPAKKTVV